MINLPINVRKRREAADVSSSPAQRSKWSRYRNRSFYIFIAPWLLGFLALTVAPMLYALFVSFTNFSGLPGSNWHWIGLRNYTEIISDHDAWRSLGLTFLYALISLPLCLAGGLGLALLLNRGLPAASFFRTIFYLPSVVPIVGAVVIWKQIFDRDAGAMNALLDLLHRSPVNWLSDATAFYAVIIIVLWTMGGNMIIFLAGLQGIPQEVQEAASIDGAGAWRRLFSMTLPLLSPIIFFQIVLGFITSLQILVQALLLTRINANSTTYFYMVYVYDQFFNMQHFGYGAALLWLLFLLILLFTLGIFRFSTIWVYYETEQR